MPWIGSMLALVCSWQSRILWKLRDGIPLSRGPYLLWGVSFGVFRRIGMGLMIIFWMSIDCLHAYQQMSTQYTWTNDYISQSSSSCRILVGKQIKVFRHTCHFEHPSCTAETQNSRQNLVLDHPCFHRSTRDIIRYHHLTPWILVAISFWTAVDITIRYPEMAVAMSQMWWRSSVEYPPDQHHPAASAASRDPRLAWKAAMTSWRCLDIFFLLLTKFVQKNGLSHNMKNKQYNSLMVSNEL